MLQNMSTETRVVVFLIISLIVSPVVTASINNFHGVHVDPITQAIYMLNGTILWIIFKSLFPNIFS
jgi:hypothetical protein